MRRITLKFKDPGRPVLANNISPTVFRSQDIESLKKLEVKSGNRTYLLKDLFMIEEEGDRLTPVDTIIIEDSSFNLKRIGEGMEGGKIIVNGDAGMHLGAYMIGGEITVNGSVDDWCGAEMSGGVIHVLEDAGNFLGANYIGSLEGMRGGIIKVEGSGKDFTGMRMAGGEIIVKGDCGSFLGYYMLNGIITVEASCGGETGARMRGGVINIYGSAEIGLGFKKIGLKKITSDSGEFTLQVFKGDLIENGEGEIRVAKLNNP
ncbi:MAG: formylmethanofuran dehydrogenase subunit C [Candidatus Odinarchaeum yellowstonii]|uniref:formylmethanofuran dehydrogenase n=1 Tax=Odinarchaeota yellowstonii (strain LCB_4) TaxID=1841599 RepID=A0AAF0IBU1_ODILC|nr:MAG: formylmethanofuran dehydrogenase subunit C [Candidatus Odinarchaeum yellowstonii]